MELCREFVPSGRQEGANVAELCRRFGISRQTGYEWLRRAAAGAAGDFADRSRRLRRSPGRSSAAVEAAVLAIRAEHGAWGGRKIARRPTDLGQPAPGASTVTAILRRHGPIDPVEAAKRGGFVRFERAAPNELWQMGFKGHFGHGEGRRQALTVLDDHSRFALCLAA